MTRTTYSTLGLIALVGLAIGFSYFQTGSLPRLNDTDNIAASASPPVYAVHALLVGEPCRPGDSYGDDLENFDADFTCQRIQATGYVRRWGNDYELSESGDFAIATALGRTTDWSRLAIACDPGIPRCGSLASLLPDESYELRCTVDVWVARYDGNLYSLDAGTIQVHDRQQSPAAISD